MAVDLKQRLYELLENFLESEGFEIYDMIVSGSARNAKIQIFIEKVDHELPVTIDDCVYVNKNIDPIIEAENLFDSDYILEVSSPGVERVLRTLEHFKRFVGEFVKVKAEEIGAVRGVLKEVLEDERIVVEDAHKRVFEIPIAKIKKANLWFKDF